MVCWYVLSPTRKETICSEQTRDLCNILPSRSIHVYFLARCSTSWKPLKKFRLLSVYPGPRGSNDLHVGRKMENFQFFFSIQRTSGSPTGPDPVNRLGDQDNGSPGRPVSSGLQIPCESEICPTRTRHIWWNSPHIFPSKHPSITSAEIINTPNWYSGFLEGNQWGGCRLDTRKLKWQIFEQIFAHGMFVSGEPLCHHTIDCCTVSGSLWYNQVSFMVTNRDKKSFRSPRKNSKFCSDDWQRWRFWPAFRRLGIHFTESFRMSKFSR